MVTERLEVRLDEERRRKLVKLAALRGAAISEVVRQMIDREYDEVDQRERLDAVRRISQLNIEDVPDPDTLSKQLARTYDVDIPGH